MNSGCICCSLVGDFGKSLKEVVDTYHPDRILIEPSGVGKLSDVIKAVQDVQDEIEAELNSFTTVVDVTKCRLYKKNFGEFFSNQIEYAGAIILSRTDKAKPEKVEESVELLRELNEKAPIITTPIEQLSGEKLLETMEHSKSLEEELLLEEEICPECGHVHEHEHHHHCHEEHDHHEHHHHHGEECGCGHTITMSTITSMNIIMMGSAVVAADTIMTMNIITIIMQMKCLQAGDERRSKPTAEKISAGS